MKLVSFLNPGAILMKMDILANHVVPAGKLID